MENEFSGGSDSSFPCISTALGEFFFSIVIEKMAVMDLLSSIPEIGTFFALSFPLFLKKSGRISKVSDRS